MLDVSPSPILPISISSSHHGVMVFPWEKGIPGWQQHENKTTYIAWSNLKFKIQTASSGAWWEDSPATGWGAVCQAGMQPVQVCVQPGWQ